MATVATGKLTRLADLVTARKRAAERAAAHLTIRDAWEKRRERMAVARRQPSSINTAAQVAQHYFRFLTERGLPGRDTPLEDAISRALAYDFAAWLQGQVSRRGPDAARWTSPLSSSTLHCYCIELKTLGNFLEREGLLPSNPLRGFTAPKLDDPSVQPYSVEEVSALKWAADHQRQWRRDRLIFSLLTDAGLRAAELCALRVTDVRLGMDEGREVGTITVRLGKGGKGRETGCGEQTAAAYREYVSHAGLRGADYLFPGADHRGALRTGSVLHIVKTWGRKAGVTGVTVHRFRHFSATEAWKNNPGDILALRDFLGHTTVQMATRYAQSAGAVRFAQSSVVDQLERQGALGTGPLRSVDFKVPSTRRIKRL